jgi:hypothetical protein
MNDDAWDDAELRDALRSPALEPPATAGLEERTVRALRDQGLLASPAAGPRLASALKQLAAAAVLVSVGYLSGARRPAAGPTSPEYLLLLREDAEFRVPEGGNAALVREYTAWAGELRRAGRLVGGEELEGAATLLPDAARLQAQGSSSISGFFLVTAPDDAGARAIALDCPHLRHGGQIELRKVRAGS